MTTDSFPIRLDTTSGEIKFVETDSDDMFNVLLNEAIAQVDDDQELPLGCSWSAAKSSYMVGKVGLKRMNFRVRASVLRTHSKEQLVEEIRMQRRRAVHYFATSEVLPCTMD